MARRKNAVESQVNVLVSVKDGYRDQLNQIAQKLKSTGLKVEEVYPIAGTVAGTVADIDRRKLETVEGVAAVEEEPVFQAY